jgi:pimeloyl-ACP methyl ester carboxylesterase
LRLAGTIVKWLAIGVIGLLIAGVIYQQIGTILDAKLAPPAREMISVSGHKFHVHCIGQGTRTFVLDAGAGAWSFEWWRLQPVLTKAGRTCAFDRAGLGWSEPTGGAHDGATAANELAALVRAARISTPFVYVGHSLGANFAMIYAAKYPKDVFALVLIEPGDPKDLLEDFHGTRGAAFAAPDCGTVCHALTAAAYFGLPRLAGHLLVTGRRSLDEHTREDYLAGMSRPSTVTATAASYFDALPKTAFEVLDIHSFGDIPVLVFASSQPRDREGNETIADVKTWRIGQLAYLASLASLSAHGMGPIVIPGSSHSSMVLGATQSAVLAQRIVAFVSSLPSKPRAAHAN